MKVSNNVVFPNDPWRDEYECSTDRTAPNNEASRSLCVSNLPEDATEEEVAKHFTPKGSYSAFKVVKNVKIAVDPDTGKSAGYAYVEFVTHDTAEAAFKASPHGTWLRPNACVMLNWTVSKSPTALDAYQIYVGNLSYDVTSQQLLQFARKYHTATRVAQVIYEPLMGQSRGYGFIHFLRDSDALDALAAMRKDPGLKLGQCTVLIRLVYRTPSAEARPYNRFSRNDKGIADNKTIFVANLDHLVTEDDLIKLYEPFGPVYSTHIAFLKHIAFVTFYDHSAAIAALTHLTGCFLKGQRLAMAWGNSQKLPADKEFEIIVEKQFATEELEYKREVETSLTPIKTTAENPSEESNKINEKNDQKKWLQQLLQTVSTEAPLRRPQQNKAAEGHQITDSIK